MRIERASGAKKVTWWTLLGLLLVPLILAGGLLATARPANTKVQAAVVNLDEMVTINGQMVPMGRQLAAAIVGEQDNITWTLADVAHAEDGLRTGQFAAVVTIPKTFSAAATSFSENKGDKAHQATIDIRVSANSPVTDAAIAQQIARIAADTLNTTLTQSYLDNIYLGFNTMGEQFTTMTNGARQLADGAKLADDGIRQAADGAAKLADGAQQLADGMPPLVDGINTMNSQGGKLMDGIGSYTDGTTQLIGGVGQLGAGLRSFESQVRNAKQDFSQLDQLKSGAAQVASGAAALDGGLTKISDILKLMTTAKLPSGGPIVPVECPVSDPQTCAVYEQVMIALQKLANGEITVPPEAFDNITCPVNDPVQCETFNEVMDLLKKLLVGNHQIPQEIIDSFQCPSADPNMCILLLKTYVAGFQTGTGVSWAMLNAPDPASGMSLRQGSSALAGGAKQLSSGINQLVDELPKQAAAQTKQLADGIGQAAAGAEQISTQGQALVTGGAELKSGAQQFKVGLATLASKVAPLPGGTQELADGARALADGLGQASPGLGRLSDGLDTFATKLAEGQSQVPHYSVNDRAQLSKVVTRPIVNTPTVLSAELASVLAVLLAIGLWLGAMATYLVLRAIPSRVLTSSRPTWQLVGSALAPGMALAGVQAVLLGVIGGAIMRLPAGTIAALVAVLLVAGAAFVAVNHAVVALFGGWGRMVLLALSVVAVAAGLTSGVPSAFGWLANLSPVTPLLDAVRSLAAGAALTEPVGALLLWLIVGLGAGYVAIARHRQLTVAQFAALRT